MITNSVFSERGRGELGGAESQEKSCVYMHEVLFTEEKIEAFFFGAGV